MGAPSRKAPSLAQGERITLSGSPGWQLVDVTPGRGVEDQVTSGSKVQASKLEHRKETSFGGPWKATEGSEQEKNMSRKRIRAAT